MLRIKERNNLNYVQKVCTGRVTQIKTKQIIPTLRTDVLKMVTPLTVGQGCTIDN